MYIDLIYARRGFVDQSPNITTILTAPSFTSLKAGDKVLDECRKGWTVLWSMAIDLESKELEFICKMQGVNDASEFYAIDKVVKYVDVERIPF